MANLAKLVAKNLSKYGKAIGVKSCTLIKVTGGTRIPGQLTGGTNPTETNYAAKGFVEMYDQRYIDGALIRVGDRKISLLGAAIAGGQVPEVGDFVVIADPNGVANRYRLINDIGGDGVGAVYICQGRA